MKILVTGGTGVIGAAAIPALLRAGHAVRLLSRHAQRDVGAFPEGVEAMDADLEDEGKLAQAINGCDVVLHIAGIVEEEPPEITFERINLAGTRHLLAAAGETGAPFFVFVSSLGAERGESAYHASKRGAEEAVRAYPGPWLILRPGNVYGPGDETISMLMKMVRTLPAVPAVGAGDQPFQPLWYADFGDALAAAVQARHLAGRTLELAGGDVTTTDEVLQKLMAITDRHPVRLPVPAWLARVGSAAMEAFGAAGKRLMERSGLGSPINSSKLSMLLEGNVIAPGNVNALTEEFGVTPTPLDDALEQLADLQPEQLPGEGVGAVKHAVYGAEIHGSPHTAAALLDLVCARMHEVMPIEFAAEPGAPEQAAEGRTMTAEIAGRGKVQVRMDERTPTRATFVTLEGHPLAGVMQLHTEDVPGAVNFSVHTFTQPADVLDWVALHTIGEIMQKLNWRRVVRRVVELSGGEAPAGVRHRTRRMDAPEAQEIHRWAGHLVQQQQRERRTAELTSAATEPSRLRPASIADDVGVAGGREN